MALAETIEKEVRQEWDERAIGRRLGVFHELVT